ncbi:MAG: asparagine synthase (glutamine-hydrolyzing) [Candidatus Ozemobacteraceae bacterium]
MCGIFGVTGEYNKPRALLALGTLHHRGPDATGFSELQESFLGQARLSIIDLSDAANQPMADVSGRYTLVFNGEIYNYPDLRRYTACSHFASTSDTEVLLYGLIAEGVSFLNRTIGMFAFALWDNREKKLLLGRDRFGKKPLYYCIDNNSFIFASEIKAITTYLPRKPTVNKAAFLDYLSFLAPLAPNTFFEEVFKLPAGHTIKWDRRQCIVEKWYDLLDNTQPSSIKDEAEALEKIEKLLISAVDYRLVSDVEVGTLLSGGIDSSLITVLYSQRRSKPVQTFCIGYDNFPQYDERRYARKVADHIGSQHHEIAAGKNDFIEALDSVIYHGDEPLNDPACIPTFLLSKLVQDTGIKVILTGEASDELFLGYDFYSDRLKYRQKVDAMSIIDQDILLANLMSNPDLSREREFMLRALRKEPVFRTTGENFNDYQKSILLNNDFFKLPCNSYSLDAISEFYHRSNAKTSDETFWMSYCDIMIWIQEVLLMKVDKMTMAHSVESRAPFLDHRLVETVLSIAPDLRKGNTNKYLLKKMAEKYLPDDIINRTKKGFSSPYLEWYYEEYSSSILDQFNKVNKELNWFNKDFLEYLYNCGYTRKFSQHVWGIIVFCRWFEKQYL